MFDEPGFPNTVDFDDDQQELCTFAYCSRAAESVDDDEVERLVASAQRRNLERGITGMLVYGNGVFFQWVEGPAAQIRDLIATLHRDPRHYDIVSLDRSEERRERVYPDWNMEQVEPDKICEVLPDALELAEDQNNVATLKRILAHLGSQPLAALGRN